MKRNINYYNLEEPTKCEYKKHEVARWRIVKKVKGKTICDFCLVYNLSD